jgi:hypothetical protein
MNVYAVHKASCTCMAAGQHSLHAPRSHMDSPKCSLNNSSGSPYTVLLISGQLPLLQIGNSPPTQASTIGCDCFCNMCRFRVLHSMVQCRAAHAAWVRHALSSSARPASTYSVLFRCRTRTAAPQGALHACRVAAHVPPEGCLEVRLVRHAGTKTEL